jgi:HD-GYP domain-containing protein (c-di-GMP phosphodiesterase class II)
VKRAERWLRAFGRAMAAHALYGPGHQARQESSDRLFGSLRELLASDERPTFTFLDDTVIYRASPVHSLKDWTWGHRLAATGVRRLEFTPAATPRGLEDLLAALQRRVAGEESGRETLRWSGIEAGGVAVHDGGGTAEGVAGSADQEIGAPHEAYGLGEEVDAVHFAFDRAAAGGPLPVEDLEAVVRTLAVALHSEGELLIPLFALRSPGDQITLHSVNSAVLAMSFSEWLGLAGGDVRAVGRAALLHDLGMARVPAEVFHVGALSPAGRVGVARHPVEGARLLLAGSPRLELAATVAYEHHLRPDGLGYPARRFHRDLHYISRIIAVCSAYDALSAERSYRPARDRETALREIETGAGPMYEPGIAWAFVQMMRRWQDRLVPATAG